MAVRISQWVGAHWLGARPAAVFWVLRWLVAVLAACATMALFRWWAVLVVKALPGSAVRLADRILGVPVGAALGLLVGTALLTIALLVPHAGLVSRWAVGARAAPPLLAGAARACETVERWVPECHGLVRWLHRAERRTRRASESTGVSWWARGRRPAPAGAAWTNTPFDFSNTGA